MSHGVYNETYRSFVEHMVKQYTDHREGSINVSLHAPTLFKLEIL